MASTDVVVLPAQGGEPKVVVEGGQSPTWRPDGGAIGFTYGAFRVADWALNFDGAMVELDVNMNPTTSIQPIADGYHEDFSPVWSPDGRWIAYHSHRTEDPVASYGAQGSTDDLYLRTADGARDSERRLTDWGHEVGTPQWSPDSRSLLFTSQSPDNRGVDQPWILSIDPETGSPLDRRPLSLPRGVERVLHAAWSNDGSAIAIEAAQADSVHALWVVQLDGGVGRVTAYVMDTYGGVDWMPGDNRVVLAAQFEGDMRLFSIAREGGNALDLTPAGMHVFQPAVSPDGQWIAATRIETRKEVWRAPLRP